MSGGAYTEAVKMPKAKDKKLKLEGPGTANIGPGGVVVDDEDWHANGKNESRSTTSVQDMNAAGYKDKPVIPSLREKKIKEVNAVLDTNKMKKMEEMSSKEKMAKGLYKEADMAKLKNAKAKIEKKLAEMEINVAEEDKIEESKKSKSPSLNELRKKTTK
jgi:hypothetical protein